jgi:hypothetical protein
MKKETLEEAAERYSEELLEAKTIQPHEKTWIKSMFIYIANWQAEQDKNKYSEYDMQQYAIFCIRCHEQGLPCIIAQDWFKLYKN